MNDKPIIGLTGGIGSGKSTVARLLAEVGAAVIDSDALNRAQLRSDEVVSTLTSWWGDSIRDASGGLDRSRIAKLIFADVAERKRLERFLHPRIAGHRRESIERYQSDPAVIAIVLDTPLLVESRVDEDCDVVIYVDANAEVRRQRVMQTRGWSEDDWIRREKSQNTLDNKRARADHVVVNNSSDLDELRSALEHLLLKLGLPGKLL